MEVVISEERVPGEKPLVTRKKTNYQLNGYFVLVT